MSTPRWWSQPFPPTGAIASEGIRNQLGRPPVDPLTVFVRETAQNSWDARVPGGPTTYRLELTTVAPTHRPTWERLLTPPPRSQQHLGIGRAVRTPNLRLLSVVDRGTSGLGGPTRADALSEHGRRDWVSFVLNVGERRDTERGGGTYGYGKAVLYRLSRVGTILVYTRTVEPDTGPTTRLIGIALGSSFETRGRVDEVPRPYTGRHWWGDVQDDHVEPLVDGEADAVARSLGIRPFLDDETGTTLVVVDPDLDDIQDTDGGPDAAARHLADTIAWQVWPILLPERGDDRMIGEVVADGRTHPVPDPAGTYPLDLFVAAYRRQRSGKGTVLECGRPRRRLGRFALEQTIVLPMPEGTGSLAAAYAGVPGDPHHVCLMRSPELVVRYHEGTPPGLVGKVYAGVFRADDDLDEIFAAAEPPTHDNWVHEQLTGDARTFVRTTFRRITEQLTKFRPIAVTTREAGAGGFALGAASNFLGGIVAAAFARSTDDGPDGGAGGRAPGQRGGGDDEGEGAGGGKGGGTTSQRVRVTALAAARAEERDGRVVVVQRFTVTGSGPVRLEARIAVGIGGGREDDAPAGAAQPAVESWTSSDGTVHRTASCDIAAPTEVELVVVPVADTLTDIAVVGTPLQVTPA
jgi:hypothetical protein